MGMRIVDRWNEDSGMGMSIGGMGMRIIMRTRMGIVEWE